MAKGFNLTAELNLRGPNNLRTVVSNIKKQVGSITANITPTVNRSSIRTIATDIRSQLGNIGVPLSVTVSRASIQNISRDIRSRLSGIDIPVSVRVNRSSLTAARRDINRQLGNVNANVNITISPTAIRNAAGLTRNLNVLNQSLNQTTTSATSAAAAIQSFATAMRGAAGTNIPRNINIGLNTAGANAANATANVRQLGGEIENFGRQAGLAIRRFAAFTTVTSVFYGLARSIQSGIAAFVDFDRELVRISQVTGDNIRDVNKLASTVTNLATTYGVSSRELAGVSLTLAQAGLTAKETERALKALALSALAPSFDDLNSTVEGSIALMRQFGISTNQLEGALGSINSVAAKFAVEASDIIAAIQRTGGVFAAASKGVSEGTDALNEFVAVFTSIRATTRESAETIATGLRTIFTRIQRGPTIEALKQFGVNLTDVEGKFVGAYKAVQLLSEGLTRLDPRDLRFSQIVEELGGFRQIGKVIPLIQEFATAQEALKVAQAGSGSLAEDAAKGQLALAVQISKVREEFLGLIRSVGDTSSFRTLVKLGLDLASSLIQVADAAKELIPLIGIFTAIRGAQALTRFGAGFVGGVRGAPTRGFAAGGYVPGVGNSDTVPAMLTPGEFVIRKKAVKKIGVSRLASLNRNNGGPIPTQYFEDGGPVVQRFTYGGSPKKGIDWKSLSKGRGKKGARGPRARFELPQPGDADFAKWQREIYAEYDADPSLPRVKHNGIPMPPEIAYANQLISEEVFGGYRRKKSGKLKKTPLGLIISAAKMPRGPRAPAGEMEKIMAGYQASPEFQKQTSGAGSSLFASLKGPLSSFKKGGTFGGVIAPGSETATKIKDALGKLLAQSSGQDAVKAKTALDKFDSFIAGGTPEKSGHVSHFTWAMNQIFKKGIATFGRGGRASSRMGVFDFDMTTGITKQKETPSLSGFRNPALAVPDILGASPTGLVELMKKYGASQILTARTGGPKGEMRSALGSFFKKNGVLLPSSRITTLGDQVGSLSTPEKKARALYGMVKKYGGLDFFDDDQANIDAAKMVRGVNARKVSVMKNLGGVVQKFMAGKAVKPEQTAKQLRDIKQKIASYALVGPGASDPLLKDALNKLNKATSPLEARLRKQIYQMIQSGSLTPEIAKQMLGVGDIQIPVGPGGKKTVQAVSLQTLKKGAETKFTRTIDGEEIDILRASPSADLSRLMTASLDKGIRVALKGFLRTALTDFAKRNPTRLQELTDLGVKFNSRGQAIPSKEMIDIAMSHGKINELRGNLFERGIMGLGATPGPSLPGKAAPIDAIKVSGIVSDIMSQGPTAISPDLPTEIKASTARTRPSSGQPNITKGGLVNQILRFQKLQRRALGGEIKGISSSRAREAILGKQLNGVEMIKAARKAGYDIEELDDGMIQLSRNNKVAHTLTRAKASELLGSMATGYNLGGKIQKFASGGSPEDTVPALLTPGEFVINKRAAKRLGSSKLNRLNRADRISGFNSGGPVGNIQSYSSGGDVQRFFFGGGARARPGTEATSQNLMISGNVMTQLREITTALQELGVASSASADLVRRGGRISVQAANAAYEADILRMRVAGAPMQTVIEAETRLANMRQQAQTQIRAQRQLSGVGGAQLQDIESTAQANMQRMIQRAQAAGVDLDENQMRRIENTAYSRAAAPSLGATRMSGLSGNDLRQFINSAMGDPRTFEQMNRQFEANRRRELLAQINAERGATTDRREIANRVREASRLAAEEANIRRQTLNQTRGAAGPGAAGGQRMQQGMFMASFAIPMLAQMLAGDPTKAASSGSAAMSAGIQGGANAVAMGTMIASMFPPGLGQGLAFAATAAAAVGQAFIDARNATIEFEKNLAAKKVEMALEDTGRLFEKLAKDVKDIDVQNAIGQKLIEASVAAQRSIEMQATTAKAFWVNMFDSFDTFGSNAAAGETGRESAQRSQILERFGTSAYLETTNIGQRFMGGSGSAQERAQEARRSYVSQMIPEQSRELSKQFAPIADNSIKLIEEKIRAGLNIEEYINTDEFKKLGTAIALANTAVSEQVLRIRNSTILSDAQKSAQEKLIISTAAEEEARKRASIAAREVQLREVQKATNQLSRSLERMFQNMEQAINKTNFGLEKMARDLDLVSSSLTGQAKAGEGAIKAINILQNPRAYGAGEVGAARSQAAGFFGGGSSDIIKGLLTLGDDIEATIMGTINRTVRETGGDSPAKIAIAIEKSVAEKLQTLQLPPDVSEKLAREVKVALNEIRKEGDEKADFTQIEEKLKDLGRILESTRRAQEVALKVLENWQNSLNSYTSSINSLTDLQIDFAARLRKSAELVINSQNNLAKTLGKDISIETLVGNRNALIRQQTGGATAPGDIFGNINRLEAQRRQQEGAIDVARQGGPGRMKDFMIMSNNLKLTNVALRENYDALRNLAENSDIAAAALNKIQEAQQRQQGKVGFIEKLVTSTPEEFESLNRAFIRLQNNANGQINTINNSVGAQKAYIEAIQGGATAMEAMRAAQTAFANERRDTLSALNDLLPFLGGGQQANQIRANTLEAMLMESGMGVSPMFQEVLNALRNPELDPETQRAIALYQEANQLQITANNFLNQINNKLQEETADKAARAIADALATTTLTFKNAEQGDLNRGVVPQNRATGGIIYASNGAFAPRGSDTVPAMLTPGEFVVNKNATAKNLPLLKSINSQKFSGGGKVKYYADGGLVSSFLSKKARTREDFQQSSEKFLDPASPEVAALLDSAKLTKQLQILPNIWYKEPNLNTLQTPARDSVLTTDRRNPIELDITSLYPDGGILPGIISHKINVSDIIEAKRLSVSPGRISTPRILPGTQESLIFGIDGDRSIDLKTKNIKKTEFEQYKEDMDKIYKNYDAINWIGNGGSPVFRAMSLNLRDQGYPNNITPISRDGNNLNPNSKEKNRVLYYGDELVSEVKDYGKLWRWTEGGLTTNALTIGNPGKPDFDNSDESAVKEITNITATSPKGIKKDSPGILKPKEIKDIVSYHAKQFDIIYNSILLAKKNFKDIKFEDSPDVAKYQELQTKFSNLYNNLSAYETFNNKDLGSFHKSFLRNASSLVVAADNNSSRNDIAQYVQKLQAKLEPGKKPTNEDGKPITVGLSTLPANLKDLTKDWVRTSEFDIFSDKGIGDVKNFPFLVNANMSDLPKGFEERAKKAILDQENKIKQEIVFDNKKLLLNLGAAGKNIELPYSATYTKYQGPLWDDVTKSFSEDPNNQLKVFLPEQANIFKGLDIRDERLYSREPFDISDFAASSIPVDSVNKLIDLVKNNGEENAINQAKNAIINDSTLTFPHRGRKVAGSLLKLENAVGQQIFSGYSQLPSTTFSFGEFLAGAVMDYAKQAKQQAGVAAGKVADDKLGQEVIGDVPMETVQVLQQLSQGALQVFGRRPVPGLPRGWLFNNIRSLQGILPRGGRTSIGRLANNDQAKAAASIIRNVISNAGAYVSNVAGRTNNPQLYNGLKDTYGLMWGAYKAFDSISKSDTRNLAQLLKTNPDAETIFRTLGASATFEKAAASSLSEDYKAILGNQLAGSKITTVNADGSITQVNPADAPPPKIENYSDLMNLALNPYNEFSSRNVRSGIFDKLISDISSAVDNRGMPYFEPNTSNFLISSLDSLKKWYGGDGAWLGQDYLFDKAANPDPANRGQQFLQNLDAGRGLYDMANMAHSNLGGSVKFGNLPGDIWFKNRVDAGNFATGGMVYAAGGTMVNFQPRGTDTVPAMLTPGEFVVNRSATQKNLPLLKSINSNTYMADGGLLEQPKVVQGVKIPGRDNLSPRINRIDKNIGINTTSIQAIDKNIASIQDSIDKLSTLTGSLDSLKDLQKQILVIADMVMKVPEAIYDQVLVSLRQLWDNIGPIFQPWALMGGWPAAPFNKGGPVYASKGQLINFQPKGTDTVPAMLTPGEFVVNRAATQKNLPLLKSINSGVGEYSSGGVIYAQDGALIPYKIGELQRSKKPPQKPIVSIDKKTKTGPKGMASAEIGAPGPRTPEGDRLRALQQQQEYQDIEYEDIFGNIRTRKESEGERWTRLNDIRPPSYDSPEFTGRFLAFIDFMTNIGEGLAAGGGRGSRKSRPQRLMPSERAALTPKTTSLNPPALDPFSSNFVPFRELKRDAKIQRNTQFMRQFELERAKQREFRDRGALAQIPAPSNAPQMSFDQLMQMAAGLKKQDLASLEFLGRGSNSAVFSINDHLALAADPLASVSSILEYIRLADNLAFKKSSDISELEAYHGSTIGSLIDTTNGEVIGGIRPRISGQTLPMPKAESVPDFIKFAAHYDAAVFERLFQDQLRLAKEGYLEGLFDAKPENMVFGPGYIRQIDIGPKGAKGPSYFPTAAPFYQFGATDPNNAAESSRVIMSKTWLELMKSNILRVTRSNIDRALKSTAVSIPDVVNTLGVQTPPELIGPAPRMRTPFSQEKIAEIILESLIKSLERNIDQGYNNFINKNNNLDPTMEDAPKLSDFGTRISQAPRSINKKNGGLIYASKGQLINFEPKGTDTVPAMLTPGEFVVNRAATQKNLPLLKAINNGAGGYSDGGVVYLQAGGGPQVRGGGGPQVRGGGGPQVRGGGGPQVRGPRVQMNQGPQPRRQRERDEEEAYKRGGLKDRLALQSADRFRVQQETSKPNRNGKLWIFTFPPESLEKDDDGKLFNNGLQFLLKDANGNPTNKLTTESLAAMDISKIFSLRSNNNVNAIKEFKQAHNNPAFQNILAVDAVSAINKTKQQQARKSFDQRILDELSYQVQTMGKKAFAVFDEGKDVFNTDPGVIAKYTKEIDDTLDKVDLNNPVTVAAGFGVLGPKIRKVKRRRDFLNEVITNNKQALAVLNAANLNFGDPANHREIFENKGFKIPATAINQTQIDQGSIELTSANKILENISNNPKIQMALRNPAISQIVQRAMIPEQGFGVPISTFEGGPGVVQEVPKLAKGGLVYAEDGMEIPRQRPPLPSQIGGRARFLPPSPRDVYLEQTKAPVGSFDSKDRPPSKPETSKAKSELYELMTNYNAFGDIPVKDIPQWELEKERQFLQGTADLFSKFTAKELYASNPNSLLKNEKVLDLSYEDVAPYGLTEGSKFLETSLRGPRDPEFRRFYSYTMKRLKEVEERIRSESSGAAGYARGGTVYANNGQLINFQSRGSDTVPAMLTPGEFVVNRQSAQNNLPLLQAINSGLYNRGGRVSYLAGGTRGTEELYKSLANFSQILNAGAESIRKVLDTIASRFDESPNRSQNITQTNNGVSNTSNPTAIVDALGNRLDRFIEQLQNALPPFIRVEGQHQVNVVINGGAILQQLLSGPIGNIVQSAIQSAFDKQSREREGF